MLDGLSSITKDWRMHRSCGLLGTSVKFEMPFGHSSVPRQNGTQLGELIFFKYPTDDTFCFSSSCHHLNSLMIKRTDFVGPCVSLSGLTSNLWLLIQNSMPLVGRPFLTLSVTILSRMRGTLWHHYQILWLSSQPVSVRGKFMSLEDIQPEVSEGAT